MKYNPLIHHRKSVRLKDYNYSNAGAYFITICTHEGERLFGKIKDEEMLLNEIGQIAYNEWLKTPEIRHNVTLVVFTIMPNHMHGILLLEETIKTPNVAVNNMSVPTLPKFRSPSNNIGAIVRGYKSAVTKQANLMNFGGSVWQRNFHEHIIRDEASYQKISAYIIDNVATWHEDKFYKE